MFFVTKNGVSMATYETYMSTFTCDSKKAGLIIGSGGSNIRDLCVKYRVQIGKARTENGMSSFDISSNRVGNIEKAYLYMDEMCKGGNPRRGNTKYEVGAPMHMYNVANVVLSNEGKKLELAPVSSNRKLWWKRAKKRLDNRIVLSKKSSDYYWGVVRSVVLRK